MIAGCEGCHRKGDLVQALKQCVKSPTTEGKTGNKHQMHDERPAAF